MRYRTCSEGCLTYADVSDYDSGRIFQVGDDDRAVRLLNLEPHGRAADELLGAGHPSIEGIFVSDPTRRLLAKGTGKL